LAVAGISRLGIGPKGELGIARDGLSAAFGAPAPSCAGGRRNWSFYKNFPITLAGIAREPGCEADIIEVWFADEARIGQKNGITRRWTRPWCCPSATPPRW
jgi:hypothetical protein